MGDPGLLDPSPFGVNAHGATDSMLRTLAGAGVRWMRVDVNWPDLEPAEGTLRWDELDRVFRTVKDLGCSVLASVAYAPAWANRGQSRVVPATDPGTFARFVGSVIGRHAGRIDALSIWNEPNLREFYAGSLETFLNRVLLPGLRAVRQADPRIVTCGPDLSSSPAGGDPTSAWLKPVLAAAGELLDVITHHQYDGHDSVAGRVAEIEHVRDAVAASGHGAKPLWITETGWDTRGGTTPEAQAALLRGLLREQASRAGWWKKAFWYDSHGPGWGLLEPDTSPLRGQPRPALAAYRELIASTPAGPGPLDVEGARVAVRHLYRGLLGREADAPGLAGYAEAIRHDGLPRIAVVARELSEGDEFRNQRSPLAVADLAADLYRGILEREPDAAGLVASVEAILAGRIAARAAEMLTSTEFQRRFLGHA